MVRRAFYGWCNMHVSSEPEEGEQEFLQIRKDTTSSLIWTKFAVKKKKGFYPKLGFFRTIMNWFFFFIFRNWFFFLFRFPNIFLPRVYEPKPLYIISGQKLEPVVWLSRKRSLNSWPEVHENSQPTEYDIDQLEKK